MKYTQSKNGRTALGFLAGLLVGLAIALTVAIITSKLPTNFLRQADKNNSQIEDIKTTEKWDANAGLSNTPNVIGDNNTTNDATAIGIIEQPNDVVIPKTVPDSDFIGNIAKSTPPTNTDSINNTANNETVAKTSNANNDDPLANIIKQRVKKRGNYIIQTGAFSSKAQAKKQVNDLASSQIYFQIIESNLNGSIIYRVRTNSMQYEEALKIQTKLNKLGVSPSVLKTN